VTLPETTGSSSLCFERSNKAVERPAGSHVLAAAAHRGRWADKVASME
jgi:hypothetical protein